MLSFPQVLNQKRALVWPEIEKYLASLASFPSYCQIPKKYSSLVSFHQHITAEYPRRQGKYLRPTLVLLTAEAMGFPQEKAIKTAAAMQVSEDWILDHDDIEDNSQERRGQPTLHRLYGAELALNAGDALHILMWKILADNFPLLGEKKALSIEKEFYQILTRTALGQTVEIKWTKENRLKLDDEDIFFILDGKTSYYTIAGPMRLGAILAEAKKSQLALLYHFGQILGRSFQIRDDLLDLTSDFAGLKKQVGNDIYEGKRTIMLAFLLRETRGEDRQKLLKILAKKREEKSEEEVRWVIRAMKKYGSISYGEKLAQNLAQEAGKFFEKHLGFLAQEPARSQIRAGISFMVERKY
ncbi:polyprenyl synthetase family protein [Candidatus Shapirobacteria bacterium]|nr:polyprenyl synthetase family protein [Candidatus Shapirobacteria bacterium]